MQRGEEIPITLTPTRLGVTVETYGFSFDMKQIGPRVARTFTAFTTTSAATNAVRYNVPHSVAALLTQYG
jgi:hypothetical protein